jgi:hypothetical protein
VDRPALIRVATLVTMLALVACGGGGGSAAPPPTPPVPPPPPPQGSDTQYLASTLSPFTANCDGVAPNGTLFVNAEVEPYLAVNPLDNTSLVGVWQQDRWSNGSSRGLMSAASSDGGQTWTRQPLAFTRCGGGNFGNGGDYARGTDPWVTFSPDGTVHAMSLSTIGDSFQPGSANAMLAARSTDRGRSWSTASTLIRDDQGFFNDKNSITADPFDAALVYAVWDRLVAGDAGGPTYFARTTNGGFTWEPARSIYDPGPASQTIGNVIAVLPSGVLVNLFTQLDRTANGNTSAHLDVIRSADKGLTWSAPSRIADLLSIGTRDPQTNAAVRDGAQLAQIAVAANGQAFVVWQDARFNNGARDAIAISRSTDGGVTWSAPTRVNAAPGVPAFTPRVHVRPDGVVGVSYYDFRSNTADPATLPTDYWLARSSDGGVTWTESRISAAFDLNTAPNAGGLFLGDYQGLKSRGNVFVPFFVKTSSGDFNNRTDVFAAPALSILSSADVARAAPTPAASRADVAERAVPASFQVTAELQQRVSEQIVRNMQSRVRGWGRATMRAGPAPPAEPPRQPPAPPRYQMR